MIASPEAEWPAATASARDVLRRLKLRRSANEQLMAGRWLSRLEHTQAVSKPSPAVRFGLEPARGYSAQSAGAGQQGKLLGAWLAQGAKIWRSAAAGHAGPPCLSERQGSGAGDPVAGRSPQECEAVGRDTSVEGHGNAMALYARHGAAYFRPALCSSPPPASRAGLARLRPRDQCGAPRARPGWLPTCSTGTTGP